MAHGFMESLGAPREHWLNLKNFKIYCLLSPRDAGKDLNAATQAIRLVHPTFIALTSRFLILTLGSQLLPSFDLVECQPGSA